MRGTEGCGTGAGHSPPAKAREMRRSGSGRDVGDNVFQAGPAQAAGSDTASVAGREAERRFLRCGLHRRIAATCVDSGKCRPQRCSDFRNSTGRMMDLKWFGAECALYSRADLPRIRAVSSADLHLDPGIAAVEPLPRFVPCFQMARRSSLPEGVPPAAHRPPCAADLWGWDPGKPRSCGARDPRVAEAGLRQSSNGRQGPRGPPEGATGGMWKFSCGNFGVVMALVGTLATLR